MYMYHNYESVDKDRMGSLLEKAYWYAVPFETIYYFQLSIYNLMVFSVFMDVCNNHHS
jgi:hypothetical protein